MRKTSPRLPISSRIARSIQTSRSKRSPHISPYLPAISPHLLKSPQRSLDVNTCSPTGVFTPQARAGAGAAALRADPARPRRVRRQGRGLLRGSASPAIEAGRRGQAGAGCPGVVKRKQRSATSRGHKPPAGTVLPHSFAGVLVRGASVRGVTPARCPGFSFTPSNARSCASVCESAL